MAEGGIRPPKPLLIAADSKEHWEDWLQSFEWYAAAVQLDKKEKNVQVATFMAIIGRDAQQVFKTFGLSAEQQEDLKVIKSKFAEYFTPKINYTFERYKFNQITQKSNECFKDFLTRLKIQASRCKLDNMEDELLRDRIVVGIENNDVREKLLSDPDLNLNKAEQICIASESAAQQLKNIVHNNEPIIATVSNKNAKSHKINSVKDTHYTKMINNCRNCGGNHKINSCPAFGKKCKICNKPNHFAKKCRSKYQGNYKVREVENVNSVFSEDENLFIASIASNKTDWSETVMINNKAVLMKLDTGAQCNAMPFCLANSLGLEIKPSNVRKLLSYSGHTIDVAGESTVFCKIKNKPIQLRLIVAHGGISPVLGRVTCTEAGLIKRVDQINSLEEEFQDLFEGMGCIKNFEYTAEFSQDCIQKEIKPPRRVPFILKPIVKLELDRMVQDGIIKKVEEPTPISSHMVIVKQKGKIRICIDPSDLNKIILRRQFPLKTLEDVTTNVAGSKFFTKLDLKKGFWQLKVSSVTQPYLTFSTPWGRYTFLRVPFGIKSAPEIFQNVITQILEGLPGVENSMDDILIYAADLPTLQRRTRLVLQALRNAGAKLNKEKCIFEVQEVKYLGHILTSEGIQIDPEKIKTIDNIKSPTCKKDLQRLLGMVQYLHKFIPNLSNKTHNMRLLLRKNAVWNWSEELEVELREIKKLLKEAPALTYFDPNKSVTVSVDASSFGLGAVLLQEGRPIAYSSTALNETQQLYPQIEKEALAMKNGCEKFHQYIYGNEVTIETDHKPLESIFKKSLDRIPPRLRKIFLGVQQYAPKVSYKRGTEMYIADLLSRDCKNEDSMEESTFQILFACPTTTTGLEILQNLTKTDPELILLKHFICTGWPQNKNSIPESCKKYLPFLDELSIQNDLILKGLRIIIPEKYRVQALENLHKGHLGISSCLRRARESMFWPGMSKDIIEMIEKCTTCQKTQRSPETEPLIPKEIPKLPWEILASDVFSYQDVDYVLITDSYSGFIDFKPLTDLSSKSTIEILKDWFSVHGIPRILESDNAPNYSSSEFENFSKEWMFIHQTSSPLYPKGNGLAERAVQTAKNLLRKSKLSGQDIRLALMNYRNTPRDNLGSPAQRLYSRRMRTTIPIAEELLRPKVMNHTEENLTEARMKQKYYHDLHTKPMSNSSIPLQPDQNVMLKKSPRNWIPAKIINQAAPRSYHIVTPEGQYRRNSCHIRPTKLKFHIQRKRKVLPDLVVPTAADQSTNIPPPDLAVPTATDLSANIQTPQIPNALQSKPVVSTPSIMKPIVTRSGRLVKPPKRIDL